MPLECKDVRKAFGGTVALAGVTLRFPDEGIVAIVGKNGAGKTTLVDSLTGVVKPDGGHWLLSGKDITGLPPYRIARLGIVRSFQGIRLVQDATVLENLILAAPGGDADRIERAFFLPTRLNEASRTDTEAMRLLKDAGLIHLAGSPVNKLSFGQQKAVSVMVAIATQADILLLDEPFAGVDAEWSSRIVAMMTSMRKARKLLVLVDHDLTALRRVADALIVMSRGQVIASGDPAEVLTRPEVVEAYLG